ncbi:hypothetical protein K435DRAFT_623427, partial [Dendrothele bispora CBS 962.96]
PQVYAWLWPTLFPYGVGFFEDHTRKTSGFREVPLYLHARNYLNLADRRFQTHLSFMFVIHNILLVRRSSSRTRLAVQRSWWPFAAQAMDNVDDATLVDFRDHLIDKKNRKDASPVKPKSKGEEAIMKLLRHVQYVDDHVDGSMGNVAMMREQIRAITRTAGTPSLFFTPNPADGHNPIVSYLAGKDINIDTLFSNPDSRFTSTDRLRTLAENPVAGASFFHLMVEEFIGKFLGVNRGDKHGVFGRVRFYYGVVE